MRREERLAVKVTDLDIPVRSKKALSEGGVATVGDLVRLREVGILRIPNVGKRTVQEIRKTLQKMKLCLPA